ncbi:MAG: TIGR00282 family metallophosphoesterase [Coraliomargaritaceae bacterium]
MPKLLFLGDIVGRPGRTYLLERLPELRESLSADFVVVNGENAAGGAGITAKIANELLSGGVDAITLGDHVWDQKNFENEMDSLPSVCRPANLPSCNPGRTHLVIERGDFRLGLFTVLGRNFMGLKAESCPFRTADEKIEELSGQCDAVFVEAHMEATSEKIALGWHLDGRVAAVVGTHTHVPTADGRVLPGGTAYMSDAGMCGPYASVLGRSTNEVVQTFLDGMKRRFPVAEGDLRLSGCSVDLDPGNGLASAFQRIEISGS